MASQLEEIEIPVPCPGCGNNTLKSIRWLRAYHQLDCRVCEETIKLDNREFRATVLDAEKSIARILKGFADPA